MRSFLFDASALVKRYAPETGAAVLDHLFASVPCERLACLMLGAAEVAAAMVRKRNGRLITPLVFAAGMTRLRVEILDATDFAKLPADNELINDSIPLSERHSINSTDAIVLRSAIDLAAELRALGDDLVLVASDQRLLRAAQAEGVATFDPETDSETVLDALLSSP
jgi:predicted nucleic acid-binding protein